MKCTKCNESFTKDGNMAHKDGQDIIVCPKCGSEKLVIHVDKEKVMEMFTVRRCPNCGKEFSENPAMSRRDKSEICPMCGHKEALEDAVNAGAMSENEANEILKALQELKK